MRSEAVEALYIVGFGSPQQSLLGWVVLCVKRFKKLKVTVFQTLGKLIVQSTSLLPAFE